MSDVRFHYEAASTHSPIFSSTMVCAICCVAQAQANADITSNVDRMPRTMVMSQSRVTCESNNSKHVAVLGLF